MDKSIASPFFDSRCITLQTLTAWFECNRPHASVDTTTPRIDRKHINCRNMPEIRTRTRYMPCVKIVNKRPRNLLNEIQNVFINGKKVKNYQDNANNSVISTILRQNNCRQLPALLHPQVPHAPTVTFAR